MILGRTEILKEMIADAGALDENVAAQIAHIRDAANRLTEMVDDLVADAMADALDITVRREPVDISVLVQEVAEANRPLAARKEQTITVAAPAIISPCAMPTASARQSTIWSATPSSTARSAEPSTSWSAQEDDGILVQIRDQGAGLSPEDISRLFGRFQRLSAKPTAGESSTGLGLSIVKRIVDLHGGRITVESAGPGQGATFKMTVAGDMTSQAQHIIVVDDEQPAREMVGDYLRMHGFTVSSVRRRCQPALRPSRSRCRT